VTPRLRFWLAWVGAALLVTLPFGATLVLVWLDLPAEKRALFSEIAQHWLPIGTMLTLVTLVIAGLVLDRLFRTYVQGLQAMAEQLDVLRTAPSDFRLPSAGPPEIRRVAEAANRLAEAREASEAAIVARVDAAKASLAAERNRLAALMAQLDEAVIVCNHEARVLLYNEAARTLVASFVPAHGAVAATSALGLGRTILTWIDPAVLGHALDRLGARVAAGERTARERFVLVAPTNRVARVRVSPVVGEEGGGDRLCSGDR